MIAAVNPAADVPLPDVYTDNGAALSANFNICDFAVDGSPNNRTFISPLKCIPPGNDFDEPDNNNDNIASFTFSRPKIPGAIDLEILVNASCSFDIFIIFDAKLIF